MTNIRKLTKAETNKLYEDFPSGRPMRFLSPAAPNGFSLVAVFANFFEKFGFCEKTPSWVREEVHKAYQDKVRDGELVPYKVMEIVPGSGKVEYTVYGTLIRANARNGDLRIAFILGKPNSFLVAVWDSKTGESRDLWTVV